MENYITVSVVSFYPEGGEKDKNQKRIAEYVEGLAAKGSHMVVFPRGALGGEAERISGSACDRIALAARTHGVYVVFGVTELGEDGSLYNAAVVYGPKGFIGSCRQIHLELEEKQFAGGTEPFLFDTPWGSVGVAVGCDGLLFPELTRYYRARGARLLVCPISLSGSAGRKEAMNALLCSAGTNNLFIAAANLYGGLGDYYGKSNIVGPVSASGEASLLAGHRFDEPEADSETVATASFDLSVLPFHTYSHLFDRNPKIGVPDWRPELYRSLWEELREEDRIQAGKGDVQ